MQSHHWRYRHTVTKDLCGEHHLTHCSKNKGALSEWQPDSYDQSTLYKVVGLIPNLKYWVYKPLHSPVSESGVDSRVWRWNDFSYSFRYSEKLHPPWQTLPAVVCQVSFGRFALITAAHTWNKMSFKRRRFFSLTAAVFTGWGFTQSAETSCCSDLWEFTAKTWSLNRKHPI